MANWDAGLNNGSILRLGVDQVGQNIGANQSSDTWILVMTRGSNTSSWTGGGIPWNVNVDGNAYSGVFSFDFRSADSVVIASGSITVNHNSDGTKTIGASASIGSTGTAVGGPAAVSGNFTQTTIPRASNITLSNGDFVDAGGTMTITTNRASSSFTHDVDYVFAAANGRAATNIGASGTWNAPLTLMNQIPNAVVGYGTFITKTYNGGAYVGQTNKVFGVTVPSSVVPTFTTITATEATTVPDVATKIGAFVKGVSKLNLNLTGAAGVYSSTITSRKMVVAGQTINAASGVTPNPINVAGTVPIVGTVTDSRNRSKSQTVNVTVLDYGVPTATIGFQRALVGGAANEEGTYIKVNMNLGVSSLVVGGTQKNTLTYKIYTRLRGASSWGSPVKTVNAVGLNFASYDLVGTYPITQAFEVMVEVIDQLSTTTVVGVVSTAKVAMHWGGQGEGVGIGKFWEAGGLDVRDGIYHRQGGLVDPPGIINPYAGATPPAGWLLCDGAAVSRATYADLFAVIGTTYGVGDGSTTFNVPNLKGRIPVGQDAAQTEFDTRGETGGAKTHTLAASEMPSHNHGVIRSTSGNPQAMVESTVAGGSGTNRFVLADGTSQLVTQNTGSGGAHNNLQPYMAMPYIIKT